ncbi:glycosyltransferase [Niallia taxi]|uniref:glycosyltransferase n=1 Tax=Niallia taxi TaxID=2499688 RepID=UPI0016427277|nr:glycosyltransferase [Niallia taxi]WOD63561.1 glycosyltransferase [Niallia taxi]
MKKLNVLLISVRADHGGGPEHIFRLVKNSDFKKINYYIACPQDEPYYEKFVSLLGEEKIIIIPHRKFSYKKLMLLRKYIMKNKIDVIHSHGKGAGIYSRFLKFITKSKVVHTYHGIHLSYNGLINKIYSLYEKVSSLVTYKIICVSSGEYELAVNKKLVFTPKKLTVVNNGVELVDGNRASYNSFFKIISVTRFNEQKNSELAIDIIEILINKFMISNLVLDFIGTGESKSELERLVKSKGLENKINFLGTKDNMQKIMSEYNIFLSTSRWEGLPIALIEALSVGLPSIVTNVVGNNDIIISSENGLLFDLEDAYKAAEQIKSLMYNEKEWEYLSNNAFESSEKYDIHEMVNKIENIYIGCKRGV